MADAAVALPMRHLVGHALITPGTGRHAPDLPGLEVLQQEPFGRRVSHRIVRPGGELVQTAVQRPGVATTRLRNLGAKGRVGQYIDPGSHRAQPGTDVETKLARSQIKLAHRCRYIGNRTRGDGDGES